MAKRRYTPEIPPGTDIAVLNEFAGGLVREKAELLGKVERLEAQLAQQARPEKIAFQFARRIYAQDGTVLAGPELYNKSDGIDYLKIKGRRWAKDNGYELIAVYDFMFELEKVGMHYAAFISIDLPDWAKRIMIIDGGTYLFTDADTFQRLFPKTTPFN